MAELVAAAASPVIEILVEKLKSEFLKQLGLARSIYTDMEKLQNKLSKIQDVLDDVEGKPITSKALQGTLRKLRDAALDAEDVLEEFETEALRRRMESHEHMTGKVRDFFSSNNPIAFRYKMARKMKEIREGFDEIVEDNRDFNSMVNSVSNLIKKKYDSDRPVDHRETTSILMVEPEIYGRVEDEKVVMNFLVDSDNDKNFSILAIVGLGGVGKTTLAQSVYNNDRIKNLFELQMWVCVGKTFDVEMILHKMIKQVGEEPKNSSILQTMSTSLEKELRTKRFLLVLDDLWNEDELEWEKLKPLFVHAKLGSKIIVTTRSECVASITGTISPWRLQGLGIDDCWTLFKQRAFKFVREEDNPELVEIGREIIKKCGGLPLAAKALGSLMSFKTERVEWLAIKNNEIWKLSEDEIKILPSLKLSYDHLPSHLKRCFLYCSIFPKDHEFEIERLIQLWMAEGLIDTSDTSLNAEDIGKQYFKNLLWRSFFQDTQMDEYNNPVTCKMHDLVHDLACSMTKDETLVMEGDTKSISHGCRYLSVTESYASSIDVKTTYEAKKLRSLILLGKGCHRIVDVDEFIFNVTKTFTRLRALDLSYGRIQKLPDRISRLKHLQFLDLSYTQIKTLPTSITRLYNLQTLNLHYCWELQELPEGIGNLCNLRYMDISMCTKITTLLTSITKLYNLQTLNLRYCHLQELPEGISNLGNLRHLNISECRNLSCIPRGLGRLSKLETLPTFIVAQENGRTIMELQHLNSIRGELVIKNLHNVKDPNEAMQANLSAKTRLKCLTLAWNEGLDEEQVPSPTEVEVEVAAGVFERLQPHHNLRELDIDARGYIGIRLPKWMSFSFPNIVELKLWRLKRCEHLPPLGRLPLLRNLSVSVMHAVKRIGEEFYGDDDGNAFPSLEAMNLCDMPNLEAWCAEPRMAGRKMTAFPRLTKLRINSCPKLTVQPCIPGSVEDLEIDSSIESLLSAGNHSGLPKLKNLSIAGFGVSSSSSSGWWDGLQYLTALENLDISDCQELTCLPDAIMYLPSLHTLQLLGNSNLRSLEGGGRKQQQPTPAFTSLQTLAISLDELEMLPDGMQHLTALQHLTIYNLPQLAMLPDGLQHLTALQFLQICDCPQLAMLPDGLQHLTALQELEICDCPQLAMLPDGLQHLTALQELHIFDCPQLERRCKRETGEDWHKIAHIPNIYISPSVPREEEDGEETGKICTFVMKFFNWFGLAHCCGHN